MFPVEARKDQGLRRGEGSWVEPRRLAPVSPFVLVLQIMYEKWKVHVHGSLYSARPDGLKLGYYAAPFLTADPLSPSTS